MRLLGWSCHRGNRPTHAPDLTDEDSVTTMGQGAGSGGRAFFPGTVGDIGRGQHCGGEPRAGNGRRPGPDGSIPPLRNRDLVVPATCTTLFLSQRWPGHVNHM